MSNLIKYLRIICGFALFISVLVFINNKSIIDVIDDSYAFKILVRIFIIILALFIAWGGKKSSRSNIFA